MKPYPLIEYAQMVGKNTAEFSLKDFAGYMKWWLKQKPRKDIMEATAAQRKVYEDDVKSMKQWREEGKMAKEMVKGNFAVDSVVVGEEEEEEVVVCSMELTRVDVDSLLWAINEIFENYDLTGSVYDLSLQSLKEGLEGV